MVKLFFEFNIFCKLILLYYVRPKLPLNIQNIEICCSGLYGFWYSQYLVKFTYILLVKMRRSMFKAHIEIKLDRPSKTVKCTHRIRGTRIRILLNCIYTVEVSTNMDLNVTTSSEQRVLLVHFLYGFRF